MFTRAGWNILRTNDAIKALGATRFIPILAIFSFFYQPSKNASKCPDLVVLQIEEPEWNAETGSTEVGVTFQNRGKGVSSSSNAILQDFDPSNKDLKRLPLQKSFREFLIREKEKITNDPYIENILVLPPLQPREKITMTFVLEGYWVYDPYCELKVTVNFDRAIDECRYKNNSNQFLSSR